MDPTDTRDIAALEALIVGSAHRAGGRQDRDRGEGFGADQFVECFGQKAHAGPAIRKTKEFHRRTFARGLGQAFVFLKFAQEIRGELDDLPRGAIGHA